MDFKESLKKISEKIDDIRGVAIADKDGIIVEEYRVDPSIDLGSMVAEFGALWPGIEKAGQSTELGASQEMTVLTDKGTILVRKVNSEYFLLLAAGSDKSFGKGRFLLRLEAGAISEELS
ncbi:MAG: hypothetical protein WAO55_06310 [Candidatus Manganitrophaceae bacterium]